MRLGTFENGARKILGAFEGAWAIHLFVLIVLIQLKVVIKGQKKKGE